jgi:hypothetical protein
MFPLRQWDKFHLKVWSWLRGGLPQGYVQFNMECDLVRYENKVETIMRIHHGILWVKANLKVFKDHPKRTTCR